MDEDENPGTGGGRVSESVDNCGRPRVVLDRKGCWDALLYAKYGWW